MRTTQAPGSNRYATHAGRDNGHLETSAGLFTARYFQRAAHVRGTGYDDPLLDWRLIQDAEANAREIATHARIPGPPAARTPGYQADATARGPGRRIGAAGQSRKAAADPAASPRRATGGHTGKKACGGNCSQ